MDGSDDDVLLRMREQADNFEVKVDDKDDKVNDGNNYKGMMSAADYKKRRAEVLEGLDEESRKREKMRIAVEAAVHADRAAAAKDVTDREERERLRKERLQRELQEKASSSSEPAAAEGGGKKKKKKKAKTGESAGLSFDADDGDDA